MRTLLGALALAFLITLGCTTKPVVKEKPVADPLFTSKKIDIGAGKPDH